MLSYQNQLGNSEELSQINDKIYPRIETLDTLMVAIPKRIKKKMLEYQQRKNNLFNQAIEEEKIEENQKQIPNYSERDFLFPGEIDLQSGNQFQDQISLSDNIQGKTIIQTSGNPIEELIEMTTSIPIPEDLQFKYCIKYSDHPQEEDDHINEFQINNNNQTDENDGFSFFKPAQSKLMAQNEISEFQKQDGQGYNAQNQLNEKKYIDPKYHYDQAILQQLLNQERLKNINIYAVNDFFLNTDTVPVVKDINSRAQILAKIYMKYNLNEELEKIQQENEEKQKNIEYKDRKRNVMMKIAAGEDPNKVLNEYDKELQSQKDIDDNNQQLKNRNSDNFEQINDKSFDDKNDQSMIAQQPKQQNTLRQSQILSQQTRKSQQILKNRQSSVENMDLLDLSTSHILGLTGQMDKEKLAQLQQQELENRKMQSQKQYIDTYFQEISIHLEQQIYQSYTKGKFKEAIKYKEEKENLQNQIKKIKTLNDSEHILRQLLMFKFQHNI